MVGKGAAAPCPPYTSSFRGVCALARANPESRTSARRLDSGSARKSAHPGMTVSASRRPGVRRPGEIDLRPLLRGQRAFLAGDPLDRDRVDGDDVEPREKTLWPY